MNDNAQSPRITFGSLDHRVQELASPRPLNGWETTVMSIHVLRISRHQADGALGRRSWASPKLEIRPSYHRYERTRSQMREDQVSTMRAKLQEVEWSLLADTVDDYVGHWSVYWQVRSPDGRGFEAWILSPREIINTITHELDALGRKPALGEIVWFTSTPPGNSAVIQQGIVGGGQS